MSKIKKGVSVVTPEKEPEDAHDAPSPELMAATSEPSDPTSGAATTTTTNNALSTSRASSVSSRRGKMTPLKIPHSGHASEYEDDEEGELTHSQRRRARISMDTVDPEHTYVERIKSPRRAADGCETLEEFDSEKRAHIADDTIDPERTYVEKLKSPRRAAECSTLEEFDLEKRAHLAGDIIDPEHTYVERIRSPCRAADGNSFEDYISEKHAHIDVAAASPHGFVHRPPTPKHSSLTPQLQPISGFNAESSEQNNNTSTNNISTNNTSTATTTTNNNNNSTNTAPTSADAQ